MKDQRQILPKSLVWKFETAMLPDGDKKQQSSNSSCIVI